ncbi:hypothetical protein ACJZ2D_015305 [Fusarium nematophilum]
MRAPSKCPSFVSRILAGDAPGFIVSHIHSAQGARDVVASRVPALRPQAVHQRTAAWERALPPLIISTSSDPNTNPLLLLRSWAWSIRNLSATLVSCSPFPQVMETDWSEPPHDPDQRSSGASGSPGPTRPAPAKRNLACERCWRRKQKCDRLLPACTACSGLGVECVARSQQFDFTVEDAGLTHATVNGYIDSLKRRVAELEHKVQVSEQKRIQTTRHASGSADILSPPGRHRLIDAAAASAQAAGNGQVLGEEESSVQDTMSAIGLLSNKAMAEPRAYSGDVPHRLAMSEVVLAALAVDGHDPSMASSSHQPAFVMEDHLIPLNRETTIDHVRRFLDWTVFLPYLDEDRLFEQYEGVVGNHDQDGNAGAPGLPHFNAYLAIAIGMMMSPEATRLSTLALSLHAAAVKLLPLNLRSQEPLDALHSIGLHKEPIPQTRLGPDSIYRTRWLFWSIYLLDRSLASTMDRPFSIQDEDISIPVPREADDDEPSLSEPTKAKLAFSSHLILHAQLISDIRTNRQTDPMFSYSNLSFWREFPPKPADVAPAVHLPVDCLDQLACRTLMLMVNSTPPADTNSAAFLGTSIDVETDAMNSCKRFIEQLYNRSGRGVTTGSFLDAYDVLSAAVVYVCLLQRARNGDQNGLTQIFEVVSKASILLTQFSSRFSALDVFQQFLLALSTRSMEGQARLSPESIPANLPGHLRRLVKHCYMGGTSAG